jgi:hypothetical protein
MDKAYANHPATKLAKLAKLDEERRAAAKFELLEIATTCMNEVLELEHGEYLDKKVADRLHKIMVEINDIAYDRYNV